MIVIQNTEIVVQDQLIASADAGKVRVRHPRGTNTVLSIGNDGALHHAPETADGAWERATVLPNGNLLFLSDTPDSMPTMVLGASLKAL